MTFSTWLSYTTACILLITPPGPTASYLVTTSINHGNKTAYEIVLGNFFGGLVCIILSVAGIGTLIQTSDSLYIVVRLLGVSYLLYLGIKSLLAATKTEQNLEAIDLPEKGKAFKNGFLLILLNPKNIIFLASFLPQFINQSANIFSQMLILSATYLIIGLVNDLLYSICASYLGTFFGKYSALWFSRIGSFTMILSALIVIIQLI